LAARVDALREEAYYLSISPPGECADRDWFKAQADAYKRVLDLLAQAPVCGVIGEPEAGRKVCELPAGHDGYHQQGNVRWLGYHPTAAQAAEASGKESR
jgi:hypothetical protein